MMLKLHHMAVEPDKFGRKAYRAGREILVAPGHIVALQDEMHGCQVITDTGALAFYVFEPAARIAELAGWRVAE